jgi:hypothetical protein
LAGVRLHVIADVHRLDIAAVGAGGVGTGLEGPKLKLSDEACLCTSGDRASQGIWQYELLSLTHSPRADVIKTLEIADRPELRFSADGRYLLCIPALRNQRGKNGLMLQRAGKLIQVIDARSGEQVRQIEP